MVPMCIANRGRIAGIAHTDGWAVLRILDTMDTLVLHIHEIAHTEQKPVLHRYPWIRRYPCAVRRGSMDLLVALPYATANAARVLHIEIRVKGRTTPDRSSTSNLRDHKRRRVR